MLVKTDFGEYEVPLDTLIPVSYPSWKGEPIRCKFISFSEQEDNLISIKYYDKEQLECYNSFNETIEKIQTDLFGGIVFNVGYITPLTVEDVL